MAEQTAHSAMDPGLPLVQFADAMARLRPSTHVAGLLEVAGAADSARACREAAWRHGELSALVANAASDILARPDEAAARLRELIEHVSRAVDDGDLEPGAAADALDLVWALALGYDRNVDLAETILFLREGYRPGPSFPTVATRAPTGNDRGALTALVSILKEIQESGDSLTQGALLLRLHFLAAGLDAPEFRQSRTLIDLASNGGGGALLSLVLHRVDRACVEDSNQPQDAADYLAFLADQPSDEQERAAFLTRSVALRARVFDAVALRAAVLKLEQADVPLPLVERELRYLRALRTGNAEAAAAIALERATASTDSALAVAWGTRALVLLREGGSAPEALLDTGRRLLPWLKRHSYPLPAVRSLAEDVTLGAYFAEGRLDEARELLGQARKNRDYRLLSAVLDVRHEQHDPLKLLPRVLEAGRRASLLVPLLAGKIDDGAQVSHLLGLYATRSGGPHGRSLRELKLFVDLFRNHDPDEVVADAVAMLVDEEPSITALWALWMAAQQRGRLPEFRPRWEAMIGDAEGELRIHLHAAIAESLVLEGAPDHAEAHLEAIPDTHWRDAIVSRLQAVTPEVTSTGTWGAVVDVADALALEPRLLELLGDGRQQLKNREWSEAATSFSRLSQLAKRPEDRYRLLVIAGRATELAPDGVDGAARLLRRAIELDPHASEAWERLLDLYLLREDHEQVAQICADPRLRLLREDTLSGLRRSAQALVDDDANAAFEIYRVLLLSMPLTTDLEGARQLFAESTECAEQAARLEELHGLAQRLEVKYEDSRLLEAVDDWLIQLRQTLGFATDVDSLIASAHDHGYDGTTLDRLEEHYRRHDDPATFTDLLTKLARDAHEPAHRANLLWRAVEIADDESLEGVDPVALAEQVLEQTPKHYRAHLRIADSRVNEARWREAVGHLESAARLIHDKTERARVYRELGEIYENHLGRKSLALESYLVSFICRSDDLRTFRRLEALYDEMGRYRDLVGSYDIAIQHARRHGDDTELDIEELLVDKARVQFQRLKQPAKAFDTLRQAIELNPTESHYIDLLVTALASHVPRDQVVAVVRTHLDALDPQAAALARRNSRWQPFIEDD